jgi:hypothetical protein
VREEVHRALDVTSGGEEECRWSPKPIGRRMIDFINVI